MAIRTRVNTRNSQKTIRTFNVGSQGGTTIDAYYGIVNANNSLLSSSIQNDTLTIIPGSGISIVGSNSNNSLIISNTSVISNNSVTLAQIQNISANTLLGRATSGSGSIEQLTLPNVKSMLGLINSSVAGRLARFTDTLGTIGSTTGLFEDGDGNVGIGTASPSTKLHVSGRSRFDSDAYPIQVYYSGASGYYIGTDSQRDFYLYNHNGGTPIIFARTATGTIGQIGIGTNSPLSKLDVNGSVAIGTYAGTTAAPTNGLIVSGNVGIGTSSVSHNLSIGGSTGISIWMDSGAGRYGQITTGNTSGVVTIRAASDNNSASVASCIVNSFNFGDSSVALVTRPIFDVQNAGSSKLFITHAGLVGIGTTAPNSKLEIAQTGGLNSLSFINTSSSNKAWTFYQNANDLRIYEGGGDRLTFQAGGNVGIGTTSPTGSGSTVLHVAGTGAGASQYGSLSLSNASYSGNYFAGSIDFYAQGTLFGSIRSLLGTGGPSGDGNLVFYTLNAGSFGERARLSSAGRFTAAVFYSGGASAYGALDESIILQSNNTGAGANSQISFRDYANNNIAAIRSVYPGGTQTGSLAFLTANAGAAAEVMRITAAGLVGIGTTDVDSRLTVKATEDNTAAIQIKRYDNDGAYQVGIGQRFLAGIGGLFDIYAASGSLVGNLTSSELVATFGARCGIGTNSPLSKLDVNGSVAIGTYAATAAAPTNGLIVSGNVGIGTSSPSTTFNLIGNYEQQSATNSTSAWVVKNVAGSIVAAIDTTNRNFLAGGGYGGSAFAVSSTTGKTTLYNSGVLAWSNSASAEQGTLDIGLSRGAAGKVYVGNGTTADYSGTLVATNIGIGRTSPSAPLDILANGSQDALYLRDSAGTVICDMGGSALGFGRIRMGSIISLTSAGISYINNVFNFGLGTITPLSKLDVRGDVRIPATNRLIFGGANGTLTLFTQIFSDTSQNDLTFRTYRDYFFETLTGDGTAGTNRFTIKSDGLVGIGTTAPLSKLDVNGSVAIGTYAATAAAPTNGLIVSGSVGIGRSSATTKLHVFNTSDNQLSLDASGQYSALYLANNNANKGSLIWDNTGSAMYFGTVDSAPLIFTTGGYLSEKMRITGAGYVGIGGTPTAKFEVLGASIVSVPATALTGAWFTGGTSTTNKPHFLIEPTGTTSTGWVGSAGTAFGINAASGFTGNLLDLQVAGVRVFSITTSSSFFLSNNPLYFADPSQTNRGFIAAAGIRLGSAQYFGWDSSAQSGGGTLDTSIWRAGAAHIRLGAAAAASPVAQTLSVQSVVTGTTNTAGANFTIAGSQGTGTGAGGSILFQTSPAGSTGTAVNALATILAITGTGRVGIGVSSPNTRLEVDGAMRLSGTTQDSFVTPVGSSVGSKINVPLFDPAAFGQLVAMGLPSTAANTTRALSLFDARTGTHQPTLAVFCPSEDDLMGISWEGTNTKAYIKTIVADMGIRVNATDLVTFKANGRVGIGTDDPSGLLDINSDVLRLRTSKTPASASATGNAGDWCWDSSFIYVCVATDTWERATLASW